jgi:hypothetical protein
MPADLVILTADELMALGSLERQAARRIARERPLVRLILRTFFRQGGPLSPDDLVAALPQQHVGALHDAVVALDDEDLLRVRDGRIDLAYPFSAIPTAFRVRFAGGQERYACCATDALGMAPMVGERVKVTSCCHYCGDPLIFGVTPDGPGPESAGVMVWFGKREDVGCKAADSL